MIETIYLEIIILALLVWVFENKILPQIIVMFLTFIMMLNELSTATDIRSIIGALLLFAIIILYSAVQTQLQDKTT